MRKRQCSRKLVTKLLVRKYPVEVKKNAVFVEISFLYFCTAEQCFFSVLILFVLFFHVLCFHFCSENCFLFINISNSKSMFRSNLGIKKRSLTPFYYNNIVNFLFKNISFSSYFATISSWTLIILVRLHPGYNFSDSTCIL